jgi:hypothetical protein
MYLTDELPGDFQERWKIFRVMFWMRGVRQHYTPPCLAQSETFVNNITQINIRYRTVTPRPALMVYVNAGRMYVPLTNKLPPPP